MANKVFEHWRRIFEVAPQEWTRYAGRYLFTLCDGPRSRWLVECGTFSRVEEYSGSGVDVEVLVSESDFLRLIRKEMNPQYAFLERRLLIRGKTKHVLRFNLLLDRLISVTHGVTEAELSL